MHNHDEINADGADDQDAAGTAQVDGEPPSSTEHPILDLDGLVDTDADADSTPPQALPQIAETFDGYPWNAPYEKALAQFAAQAAMARDTVNAVLASQRYLAGLSTAERRLADIAAAHVSLHKQMADLAVPAIGNQFVEQVMPNVMALTGGTGFYTPAVLAAQQSIMGPGLSVQRTMGQLWSSVAALNAWQSPMWDMVKKLDAVRWWSQQQLSVTNFITQDFRHSLFDVLRTIRDHLAELDGEQASWFARSLYRAALITRDAVLTDPESAPKVRTFARQWLRIKDVTQYVLEAVIDVLLDDDWHELPLSDDELQRYLRKQVDKRHEVTRPITERTLKRQRVQSLSTPVTVVDGTVITLEQVVADPRAIDDEVFDRLGGKWSDDRLIRVYGQLDTDGQAIADTWANGDPDLTWRQAGDLAGYDPARGEATRRRLHYLAKEHDRRQLLRPHQDAPARRWDR